MKAKTRSSFHTIPNYLTFFRILCIPVFIWFFLSDLPNGKLWAAVVFAAASVTDFFDGYLARKLGQVTEFGVFMDQFADKLLVWPALLLFSTVPQLNVPLWFGIAIFLRDLIMTVLRAVVKKKTGLSMKTSYWGKSKSAVQMFTVIYILLVLASLDVSSGFLLAFSESSLNLMLPFWFMALSVFLTLLSMVIYFFDNKDALKKMVGG